MAGLRLPVSLREVTPPTHLPVSTVGAGKGLPKEDMLDLSSMTGKYSYSLIDVVDGLPLPPQSVGIDTFFFEQRNDVQDHLDSQESDGV